MNSLFQIQGLSCAFPGTMGRFSDQDCKVIELPIAAFAWGGDLTSTSAVIAMPLVFDGGNLIPVCDLTHLRFLGPA